MLPVWTLYICTPIYELLYICTPIYELLYICTPIYELLYICTPIYEFPFDNVFSLYTFPQRYTLHNIFSCGLYNTIRDHFRLLWSLFDVVKGQVNVFQPYSDRSVAQNQNFDLLWGTNAMSSWKDLACRTYPRHGYLKDFINLLRRCADSGVRTTTFRARGLGATIYATVGLGTCLGNTFTRYLYKESR